ncbi:helix-turn-helix domain-containing protein [Amylibacter sp. SFDW26]|uniref:XRE family transcriptional regulator n=1 Tax=Amylibacter sp. SFDW26 TaxID=2652722 RepID=UPI00126295BB|nr:XRE family transcriptional regulator [Amylibacter sp. SFDW26]KAB7614703.1 helix-turn-helix domain-containing protein [Amylibacter sp. SFDW26]
MPRTLLGTRIRENRRSKKISQAALAKSAGISASYLNLIEHNRRGIGGKTLLALARVLEIDPRELTEGADQALIDRVNQSAASTPSINCETSRTEEFIARFPGFARLIGRQFEQSAAQGETLQAMSDQMNNDPFFSEAMHLMLSNITTIKSTAEILSDDQTLPDTLKGKFLNNLLDEANRLAQTAEDILQHFEPSPENNTQTSDNATAEALLEQHDFYIDDLEKNGTSAQVYMDTLSIPDEEQPETLKTLERYTEITKMLPIQAFLPIAQKLQFNPIALSQDLNIPLTLILKRLAHMPRADDIPRFGIMECDGSGAVIFRKKLPTLSLPRFSGACPLWPIYRSLSQPYQPIKAFINTPTGERFLTYSLAQYDEPNAIGMPARASAVMAFTPDYDMLLTKPQIASQPNLAVGLQCPVCPRDNCAARRSKYLLQ